jgi:hypothetical protein
VRDLHGLIQHSFAVRVSRALDPLYAREEIPNARRLLQTIFAPDGFVLGQAEVEYDPEDDGRGRPWSHSALVRHRQTTIEPRRFVFKDRDKGLEDRREILPAPLAWSGDGCGSGSDDEDRWEGFVVGGVERSGETRDKDFLVEPKTGAEEEGATLSRLLCQLLAHRRSRLFGLPLARETVNVLLPHALLEPNEPTGSKRNGWFAQPALSLFYVYGCRGFRPIFSFSLFLIPYDASGTGLPGRTMSKEEMHDSVRNQWTLVTAFNPEQRTGFSVSGPLGGYLSSVAGPAMSSLGMRIANGTWTGANGEGDGQRLTLRTFTEATLFAITLRMTRGSSSLPAKRVRREIGDRVLTALSASRVSSVVVVDDNCDGVPDTSRAPGTCTKPDLSTLLTDVAREISRPYRIPHRIASTGEAGYRLDRYFFDTDQYATAVLPTSRCVVTVGNRCAQQGLERSAFLEAGWTAYMVIGAATATGMIRSVFRDISRSDRSKPDSIADIEREAMVELHETYDLEIMTEAYRSRYRLLRERLGITAEYQALSDKLEALYRETSTRYEGRSERRLQLLTWATAILSAVIAVGTLVLIFKGG